jgi:hypothetical protein
MVRAPPGCNNVGRARPQYYHAGGYMVWDGTEIKS